ncbi:MAG: HEAT repeat domain-containing protein [Acidobacteriota bacterium]
MEIVARTRPRGQWSELALTLALAAMLVPAAARQAIASPFEPVELRARLLADADARRFDRLALGHLSRHRLSGVRAATAALLGQLANPKGLGLLAALAADPDPVVRAAAAEATGRLGAELGAKASIQSKIEEILERLLADRNQGVRSAAAWAIGMAGATHSGRMLVDRLRREGDGEVRAALLAELWRSRGAEWVGVAAAVLADPSPGVRRAAAFSLARSPSGAALPALRQAARDPDASVRIAALDAARRGKAVELWEELCAACEDQSGAVRAAALAGLSAALDAASERTLPAGLASRLGALLEEADPERAHERVEAIRLAGRARLEAYRLIGIVASGEPWLAGEALAALARSRAPQADALAREWLAAKDALRRQAAVSALRYLTDGRALLVQSLADEAAVVRLAAVDELAALEPPATETITKRLGDGDPAVRAAAVEALAKLHAMPPEADLLALLGREEGEAVSDAAVALIEALAAPPALAKPARRTLEKLTGGSDPVVARAAWKALQRHRIDGPLPTVATGERPSFYRDVLAWAAAPRWLEVVTVRGTILIALDTLHAPLTCFRIARLAEKKYFDNLTFHRVVPNFVVQGGDPRGDGWGGAWLRGSRRALPCSLSSRRGWAGACRPRHRRVAALHHLERAGSPERPLPPPWRGGRRPRGGEPAPPR